MMKKCLLSAMVVVGLAGTAFAQDTAPPVESTPPVVSTPPVESTPPVVSAAPVDAALTADFLAADTAFAGRDVASEGDLAAAQATYPELVGKDDALLALEAFPGIANTNAAEAAYSAIIPKAIDKDLVRAVDGLYRAQNYKGISSLLTYKSPEGVTETSGEVKRKAEIARKIRKAVFNNCWKTAIVPINPTNFGTALPEYYYYRAACMSREAEASTLLERLGALKDLLGTFTDGFKVPNSDVFEGGGLGRVQAAVKGNPEAKLLITIYNPAEALKIINVSLAAGSSEATLQQTPEGFLFCENYYRKAITLKVLEKTTEAKAVVDEAIASLSDLPAGTVPESIRAENNHCLAEVTALGLTL